ncbi:cyclophilin-like fold protein [Terrimonas pollutisoli]|uniref:cyclophilin-like fold protein n=1 Tax=Terrimonas pollutisoli TaxID=3034147 RepID=UPI0023EAA2F1|nr:cyclophilin-like fold protein [Terrimonas sp. H1YJ31]
MKVIIALLLALIFIPLYACKADGDTASANNSNNITITDSMKLRITVGDKVLTARLYDNVTTRDFIALLPITVNLEDFAGTEKIFYPSRTLSTNERKAVSDPAIGDINCYAPWGNIAIFYKNYSGSRDLIRIGRIEGAIDALSIPGSVNNVKFELVQ